MKYYEDTDEPILECDAINHIGDHVWELVDAKGISCGMVCEKCVKQRKASYRPEIFTDPNYDTMETDLYGSWADDEHDY